MVPASFDESTLNAESPPTAIPIPGVPDILAVSLGVLQLGDERLPKIYSCWKMTKEEKALFDRTGRIWLTVFSNVMPNVRLTVEKPEMGAIEQVESLPPVVPPTNDSPTQGFNPELN